MKKLISSDRNELLPKRNLWNTPEQSFNEGQRTAEAVNVKERLEGSQTNAREDVNGKAKEVAAEIKGLHDKVQPMGQAVFDQFKRVIENNIGNIDLANIQSLNPDQIQNILEEKISTLREENNATLLKLDNGLDQIMARVELRKELAVKLAEVGEKTLIGTKFEEKIRSIDTNLETPMALNQFRNQLEIAHEFKKYSQLVDLTRRYGAIPSGGKKGIENAKVIPEVGIAYGASGNQNYFKHWSEIRPGQELPDVYAIDKRNGRIQKFNWQGQGYGAQAWVLADTPGMEYAEFMSSAYRNRDGSPNEALRALMPKDSDVTAEDLEKMTQNQRFERGFIDAASRNYQPPENERGIYTAFEQKFNELQRANLEAYRSNPDHPPFGHHLTQMLSYMRSKEYRNSLKNTSRQTAEQTPTTPEVNLNNAAFSLKSNENPEVEQKTDHFELKSGKIETDRALLSFDEIGPGVNMVIDESKKPTWKPGANAASIEVFRDYFEVANNQINFKRNHPNKAVLTFEVGHEIIIPIKLKKGTQEVSREIKIQIKEKENPPSATPTTPETTPNTGNVPAAGSDAVNSILGSRGGQTTPPPLSGTIADVGSGDIASPNSGSIAGISSSDIAAPTSGSGADINSGGGIADVNSNR